MNKQKISGKITAVWIVTGFFLAAALLLIWLARTPEQINEMLWRASNGMKTYAVITHIISAVALTAGIAIKKIRNVLFTLLMLFFSVSAVVSAVTYVIIPNIIIYGLYAVLITTGLLRKEFDFNLRKKSGLSLFFGFLGIAGGFWYLHWVEQPVLLNALFFSPLGIVNCPTMLAVCGLLILNSNTKSQLLEFVAGLSTLWLGFFGIFTLDVYYDILLIMTALFILINFGSGLARKSLADRNNPAGNVFEGGKFHE